MDIAASKPEIKAFFDQQPVMNGHASGLQGKSGHLFMLLSTAYFIFCLIRIL